MHHNLYSKKNMCIKDAGYMSSFIDLSYVGINKKQRKEVKEPNPMLQTSKSTRLGQSHPAMLEWSTNEKAGRQHPA